jgi:hypothetical protein
MANIARMPSQWVDMQNNVSIVDTFADSLGTNKWTTTKSSGYTVAVGTGVGGILVYTGDTTAEDEAYVYSTNTVFKCGNGYSLEAKALLQYTEANTNAANVCFGFISSPGAAQMTASGGGPRVTGNVIFLYKVYGGTVWRCQTRWGSSANYQDAVSTTTAGVANYQELAISVSDGGSSGQSMVTFYVDGIQLKDANSNPIIQYFTNSSASPMALSIGLKQGSTTAETLNLDKCFASQSY